MGTLNEDLTAIKTIEDGLVNNKVAKFAYTDLAYCCNCVAGVETYDANNEQNIPVGTASAMKVNDTVLNKGYRAQASSVTRMLLNHFLGRLSYNLNKVNDNVANLLSTLISHRGTANGLATLDTNAKVPNSEIPLNIVRTVNGVGTADGAVTITYNDIGLSSTAGCPLGTASAGTMATPARADHVHPITDIYTGKKDGTPYYGLTINGRNGNPENISDSYNFVRTPYLGLIPYCESVNGHGSLGTEAWQFTNAYIKNVYGTVYGTLHGTADCARYVQRYAYNDLYDFDVALFNDSSCCTEAYLYASNACRLKFNSGTGVLSAVCFSGTSANAMTLSGYSLALQNWACTVVARDEHGYICGGYFNSDINNEDPANFPEYSLMFSGNDKWIRRASPASIKVGSATCSNTIYNIGAGYATFRWEGQQGQPDWVFGSNDGVNIYVWNPAKFNVSHANSAGTATCANVAGASESIFMHTVGSSSSCPVYYDSTSERIVNNSSTMILLIVGGDSIFLPAISSTQVGQPTGYMVYMNVASI